MPDLYEQDANEECQTETEDGESTSVESLDQKHNKRDYILSHLQSGRSITGEEALKLYGCASVSGAVHVLRNDGWPIATCRRKGEETFYRMVYHRRPQEEPQLFANQPVTATEQPDPPPVAEPKQPKRRAVDAESVAVRMGADGLELQVDDGVFYRLSVQQIGYLHDILGYFMETSGK